MFAGLLQLFWFSFALIGLGLVLACKRLGIIAPAGKTTEILRSLNPLAGGFVYLAAGLGVFALPVAAGYIFNLSLYVFVWLYAVLLAGSVCLIALERQFAWKGLVWSSRRLARRDWLVYGLLFALFAVEYVIALRVGAGLTDDSMEHVTRIQSMANFGHLTFSGPYTGYNGVVDYRYSANLMNGLQAVATRLFNVPAYRVWFYSFAFYRLLLTLSLFALMRSYLGRFMPKLWPYFIVLLVPYFCNTYVFDYAELPHAVAMAWTTLALIGLRHLFIDDNPALFLLGVLLVAATHPLTATYTLAFLGLLLGVLVLRRRITRRQVGIFALAIVLLAIPAAASYMQPVSMVQSAGKASSVEDGHGFHTLDVYTTKKGPVVWPVFALLDKGRFSRQAQPTVAYVALPVDLWAIGSCVVILGYVLLLKRLKSRTIKQISLVLLTLLLLGTFNSLYMAAVAYGYVAYKNKNKAVRATIFLAVIFFALIAYDPIVLTLVYGRLPLWVVARFEDLNTFMFVAPLLGVFLIYRLVARYWKIGGMAAGYSLFALLLVVNYGLPRFPLNSARLFSFNQADRVNNQYNYRTVQALSRLDAATRNQVVYTSDGPVSDWLPVASTGQIGEVYNSYENQTSNGFRRQQCSNRLSNHLALADLRAARVTRVVLPVNSKIQIQESVVRLAATKPYLTPLQKTAHYIVYRVDPQPTPAAVLKASVCDIPYGQ